jgi:hypothetical protein
MADHVCPLIPALCQQPTGMLIDKFYLTTPVPDLFLALLRLQWLLLLILSKLALTQYVRFPR